jgi:sec-independent protein translocase protein TatB
MFDMTSGKLLILGIVALLVIGPKDLPALLRTIGKYIGIIKRHAAEFRAQFDEAMRDSELQQLKKDVESMGQEAEATMREAEQSVNAELAGVNQSVDAAMAVDTPPAADPLATNADGLPLAIESPDKAAAEAAPALNGAAHAAEAPAPAPAEQPRAETAVAGEAGGTGAKTGA